MLTNFERFTSQKARVMVTTHGRGLDAKRVNLVIIYDMVADPDDYAQRIGCIGTTTTQGGVALSFLTSEHDTWTMSLVSQRFELEVAPLPKAAANIVDVCKLV